VRWLIIHPGPEWSVADVYAGWSEALTALGEEVQEYNLNRRLTFYDLAAFETGAHDPAGYPQFKKAVTHDEAIGMAAEGVRAKCFDWWPDVVLLISAFYTPPLTLEIIRARGIKIVMIFTEGPYQTETQLRVAPYGDLSLVNDPVDIGRYQEIGPAAYMPHAHRPSVHHPGPPDPKLECDLAFIGTAFPSRVKFLEQMDLDGLDVLLAGMWLNLPEGSPLRKMVGHDLAECIDNDQAADVYRSARAGLNLYRTETEPDASAEGWACGPREIEMAACGLFFLRDPRGEGDVLFPMLPKFSSPEEASEQLRWFLARDRLRERLAGQARDAVAGRTFEASAKELLRLLDRQPVSM
jgi:spore maturation protein CgeB